MPGKVILGAQWGDEGKVSLLIFFAQRRIWLSAARAATTMPVTPL